MPHSPPPSLDPAEADRFDRVADDWWNPDGRLGALHGMTPVRLDAVLEQVSVQFGRDLRQDAPLAGLRVLDAGCGGGLASEPFARLGAAVLGLDPVESAVEAARRHAEEAGLAIEYRTATIESLRPGRDVFDLVLALELLEHLPDPPSFLQAASRLMADDGLLALTTLNRTPLSYALAIVAAERLLRWVPRGAHDWRKFLRPDELAAMLEGAGLREACRTGFVYRPLTGEWHADARSLDVNYAMFAIRPEAGTCG